MLFSQFAGGLLFLKLCSFFPLFFFLFLFFSFVVFAGMVTLGFTLSDKFIFQCKGNMPYVGYILNSFLGWGVYGVGFGQRYAELSKALFLVYIKSPIIITGLQHRAFHLGRRSAVLNTARPEQQTQQFYDPNEKQKAGPHFKSHL